jgi:nicotinamidase-related amidase
MAFGVQSIDRQVLKNNTVALAKAAKVFNIPTIITTVETESFSGNTYPELLDVFPGQDILERTSMNSWDDQKVRDALKANGKKKVVVPVCGPKCATTALPCARCWKATTKFIWWRTRPAAPPKKPTITRCSA